MVWLLDGLLLIDPEYHRDTKVIVTVTATTRHGKVPKVVSVQKSVSKAPATDLIDLATSQFKRPLAIGAYVEQLLTAKRFDKIEIFDPLEA